MSNSLISLGLGFGGGKASTSNGRISGGGAPPAWNGNTYSISFDGSDDYLEVGNVSGLTGTSFSISAWFYLTASPSGEGIFGAGSSSSDRIWLQVLDSNTIRFGSLGNIDTFDLSSGTFSLNTWYHVVGVIDGTSKEVFIDSSSLGTTTVSSLSGTNGNSVRIGALPSQTVAFGALNPYQGILDELAVFNTALSSTNVSSIYNSGTPNDLSSYSPVGWWRMGDNDSGTGTTITDQGSGGNDGTLTNGPTFSTNVPYNYYSLDFDGTDDYMSIADANIFSLGNGSGTDNAFSISAWFNADSIGTFHIATKDASSAREWSFRTVSSQLHFFAFGTGGGYIGRKYGTNLNTGQWYHAVVTYDASKASSGIKLYLNGTRVDDADYASGTFTASKNTSTAVRVGGLENGSGSSDGKLDEVAIFNTELSASDVTAIYNSGVPTDISSLNPVGWWRMGDNNSGTGTTITDQGSGGNNGTLNNGPTFSTTVPS